MAGSYGEHTAPTQLHSPLVGLEVRCDRGATVTLPLRADFEYGLLPLTGGLAVAGETWIANELAYLAAGRTAVTLQMQAGTRLLLIGGAPFADPVTMWWNFVGPDLASIRVYREAWQAQSERFGSVPGGEGRRLMAPPLP
jgi:redox-sensitive bicupin YhaK (pirin superfamily)